MYRHLYYNRIQENGKDDEQEWDHDEVGLHPVVLPLLPLPVVQVPSFRLRFTLVALVVVALELVDLLEAIFPVLIDSWNGYLRTPHTTSSSLQYQRHIKILTKIVKRKMCLHSCIIREDLVQCKRSSHVRNI